MIAFNLSLNSLQTNIGSDCNSKSLTLLESQDIVFLAPTGLYFFVPGEEEAMREEAWLH